MRRVAWVGLFVFVFSGIVPSAPVSAEPRQYIELQGRCSLDLPVRFQRAGPAQAPSPKESSGQGFSSQDGEVVYIFYHDAEGPDSRLSDLVQKTIDVGQTGISGFALGQNGVRPAILDGEPALMYDYSTDDYLHPGSGDHLRGTQIAAIHLGVYFQVAFIASDTSFDLLWSDIPPIVGSFHFLPPGIVTGVYTDPLGRFTFIAPSGYDLVPNIADQVSGNELSLVTLSANRLPDEGSGSYLTIRTIQKIVSFDDLFKVYATQGQAYLLNDKRVEQPPGTLHRGTLDGHIEGLRDFYQWTDAGARLHVSQAFTVVSGTQYVISASVLDGDSNTSPDMLDRVLSSFHFQNQ